VLLASNRYFGGVDLPSDPFHSDPNRSLNPDNHFLWDLANEEVFTLWFMADQSNSWVYLDVDRDRNLAVGNAKLIEAIQ